MTDNNNIKSAFYLSIFTIVYNIAEGLISIYFGVNDDTLSLLGFGLDSFVETISATGILYMVIQLKKSGNSKKSIFEKRALKITAISFFCLVAFIVASAVINVINHNKPSTTIPGVIISIISIAIMVWLIWAKLKVAKSLNSAALKADAKCSMVCVYMSIALLISSAAYELLHISYIDIVGAAAIAYFSLKEGIEAWQKSIDKCTCSCNCH